MTIRGNEGAETLTVAGLIDRLKAFPMELAVHIRDADTGWDIDLRPDEDPVEKASDDLGEYVILQGKYW